MHKWVYAYARSKYEAAGKNSNNLSINLWRSLSWWAYYVEFDILFFHQLLRMDPAVGQLPSCQAQSRAKIEEAFKSLESEIYPTDARLFRSMVLGDVWNAAREIENEQSARKSLRNTRRIQPLLDALKIFGNAIDPLCQGTPYLCFIWVRDHLAT